EMMPGDYASIHLDVTPAGSVLSVPASALIFDAKGLSIATVDARQRVQLKSVSIARDLGTVVEVASGLAPTDRVIEDPPDGIENGAAVRLTGAPTVDVAGAGKPVRKSSRG